MSEVKLRAALQALMLLRETVATVGEIARALNDNRDGEPLTDADLDAMRARSASALERLREARGDDGASAEFRKDQSGG